MRVVVSIDLFQTLERRIDLAAHGLLIISRQTVEYFLVDDQNPDDVGQRQIDHVLDLRVPLESDRTSRRIRGGVDKPGLQTCIHICQWKRNRRHATRLESGFSNAIALRNPHFRGFEIILVLDVLDAHQIREPAAADAECFETRLLETFLQQRIDVGAHLVDLIL